MNPARISPQARITTQIVDERPEDCEHCGWENNPVVAAIYWDPAHTTTPGYTEACAGCLPGKVDDALDATYPDKPITVERYILASRKPVAA